MNPDLFPILYLAAALIATCLFFAGFCLARLIGERQIGSRELRAFYQGFAEGRRCERDESEQES